jgi:hypothetical protein
MNPSEDNRTLEEILYRAAALRTEALQAVDRDREAAAKKAAKERGDDQSVCFSLAQEILPLQLHQFVRFPKEWSVSDTSLFLNVPKCVPIQMRFGREMGNHTKPRGRKSPFFYVSVPKIDYDEDTNLYRVAFIYGSSLIFKADSLDAALGVALERHRVETSEIQARADTKNAENAKLKTDTFDPPNLTPPTLSLGERLVNLISEIAWNDQTG